MPRADPAARSDTSRTVSMPSVAWAAVVVAVVFVAYAALEMSSPADGVEGLVDVLIFPALGLIYAPLCALVATRARGRSRTAWWAMTIGLVSWALGEIILAYYELTRTEVPFPSWADAAYLFYVPAVAVALVLFASGYGWQDTGRLVLDGLIVTGSFVLISWLVVLRETWHRQGLDAVRFGVSLAYPVGDILVMTLGVMVLIRAPARLRVPYALLVAGLACAVVADSLWVHVSNTEAHAIGPLPHLLYVANPLLIILALVAAYHAGSDEAPGATAPGRLSLVLPLLPLIGAAVAVGLSEKEVVTEPPVIVIGAVLVVAMVLRQILESAELVRREKEIRTLADRLTGDLESAARYVASILPGPLDGPVPVSSRYLPASSVGGDSFGYSWIDADHLIVYLIDVSGHGVRPALLSVSVHNTLRSGGLKKGKLRAPERVLADLNARFSMDSQDDHYFTMWFGAYQLSTGVLRYATAGHPPPLVGTVEAGIAEVVPLPGAGLPIGMFADSEFSAESYVVPAGAWILLYSDGVLGEAPTADEFVARCRQSASESSPWLDDLIDRLPPSEDDRSLVLLSFPSDREPLDPGAEQTSSTGGAPR